jgi:hypothetical protein
MTRSLGANLAMVRRVAERLGELRDQVVFLGGAATALLITDSAVPDVRATIDVDLIVETASRGDYYRFAEALRSQGFTEHQGEDAPVCRWRVDGITVDVMPTSAEVLGFSNRWYSRAMQTATAMRIADSLTIRVVTAPYFIATKLDAFWSRGKGDFMASHDLEDIITLLDGRPEIIEEVAVADSEVHRLLSETFEKFLSDGRFLEALPGHLLLDQASQQRVTVLKGRMRRIADFGNM